MDAAFDGASHHARALVIQRGMVEKAMHPHRPVLHQSEPGSSSFFVVARPDGKPLCTFPGPMLRDFHYHMNVEPGAQKATVARIPEGPPCRIPTPKPVISTIFSIPTPT